MKSRLLIFIAAVAVMFSFGCTEEQLELAKELAEQYGVDMETLAQSTEDVGDIVKVTGDINEVVEEDIGGVMEALETIDEVTEQLDEIQEQMARVGQESQSGMQKPDVMKRGAPSREKKTALRRVPRKMVVDPWICSELEEKKPSDLELDKEYTCTMRIEGPGMEGEQEGGGEAVEATYVIREDGDGNPDTRLVEVTHPVPDPFVVEETQSYLIDTRNEECGFFVWNDEWGSPPVCSEVTTGTFTICTDLSCPDEGGCKWFDKRPDQVEGITGITCEEDKTDIIICEACEVCPPEECGEEVEMCWKNIGHEWERWVLSNCTKDVNTGIVTCTDPNCTGDYCSWTADEWTAGILDNCGTNTAGLTYTICTDTEGCWTDWEDNAICPEWIYQPCGGAREGLTIESIDASKTPINICESCGYNCWMDWDEATQSDVERCRDECWQWPGEKEEGMECFKSDPDNETWIVCSDPECPEGECGEWIWDPRWGEAPPECHVETEKSLNICGECRPDPWRPVGGWESIDRLREFKDRSSESETHSFNECAHLPRVKFLDDKGERFKLGVEIVELLTVGDKDAILAKAEDYLIGEDDCIRDTMIRVMERTFPTPPEGEFRPLKEVEVEFNIGPHIDLDEVTFIDPELFKEKGARVRLGMTTFPGDKSEIRAEFSKLGSFENFLASLDNDEVRELTKNTLKKFDIGPTPDDLNAEYCEGEFETGVRGGKAPHGETSFARFARCGEHFFGEGMEGGYWWELYHEFRSIRPPMIDGKLPDMFPFLEEGFGLTQGVYGALVSIVVDEESDLDLPEGMKKCQEIFRGIEHVTVHITDGSKDAEGKYISVEEEEHVIRFMTDPSGATCGPVMVKDDWNTPEIEGFVIDEDKDTVAGDITTEDEKELTFIISDVSTENSTLEFTIGEEGQAGYVDGTIEFFPEDEEGLIGEGEVTIITDEGKTINVDVDIAEDGWREVTGEVDVEDGKTIEFTQTKTGAETSTLVLEIVEDDTVIAKGEIDFYPAGTNEADDKAIGNGTLTPAKEGAKELTITFYENGVTVYAGKEPVDDTLE